MVEFVQPAYTFVENETMGIIQVRKSNVSYAQFQIRVLGSELIYMIEYPHVHLLHTNIGPSASSPVERSAAAIDKIITFEEGPSASNVTDIMISIADDRVALEANESYVTTLQILGTPDNVVLGQHSTATVMVLDDDRKSLDLFYI